MPEDKKADAAASSEALYNWWFQAIPKLFGAATPASPVPAPAAGSPAAGEPPPQPPYPVGPMLQALDMTQKLLGPLYQTYFQALLAHPQQPDQALAAFRDMVQSPMRRTAESLAGITQSLSAQRGATAGAWDLMTGPMAMVGEAVKPVSKNLERAYGGLADAFGLAPSRSLIDAGREMAAASLSKQQAQAEYLGLVFAALAKGIDSTMTRLGEMGLRGESVDSLLALVRLCARTADEALHQDLQSPQALEASAKLLRAAVRSRDQQQRVVAVVSEALNVPTRAEVDDAYREIQELKRELRRLKKALAPAVVTATVAESATDPTTADTVDASQSVSTRAPGIAAPAAPAAAKRTRAPAAKRTKTAKVTSS